MARLHDRVAVITGAADGIGHGIARRFAPWSTGPINLPSGAWSRAARAKKIDRATPRALVKATQCPLGPWQTIGLFRMSRRRGDVGQLACARRGLGAWLSSVARKPSTKEWVAASPST